MNALVRRSLLPIILGLLAASAAVNRSGYECDVGVSFPAAGEDRVSLHDWPHLLTPALWIAAVGLLICVAGLFHFCFSSRPANGTPSHA